MDGVTVNEVANIDIRGMDITMLKRNLEMWQSYTDGSDELHANLTALINQTNEYLHVLNVGGTINRHLFSPQARLPWAVEGRRLATFLEPT